jgi:hypothetical protein
MGDVGKMQLGAGRGGSIQIRSGGMRPGNRNEVLKDPQGNSREA